MSLDKMLNYYRQQSFVTDPKSLASLFDRIPDDILTIAATVQGLVFHYMADTDFLGYKYPASDLAEIDIRYVDDMLARLMAKDDRPLAEAREYKNRIVGCCRDFSTLFCSILRHKGIPCRVRYGFATYFIPDFYVDHVVAEYWNGERWVLLDPELTPTHIERMNLKFDVGDVPHDLFIIGGDAWKLVRQQGADPQKFGVIPEMEDPRGMSFVALHILQDIAGLNQHETLCWDAWSYALEDGEYSDSTLKRLDELADLSMRDDVESWTQLRELYQSDNTITVPNPVMCFSPAFPQPAPVALRV